MADLGVLREIFAPYRTTLQETSADTTHTIFLCKSQEVVINFDAYMQEDAQKKASDTKNSFDALYFENQGSDIYCVEFKNQKYSEIKNKEVKDKFIEGLSRLKELFGKNNLKMNDYNFNLFVVFKNPESNGAMTAYQIRTKKRGIMLGIKSDEFIECLKSINVHNPRILLDCVDNFKQEYKNIFHSITDC